jgi:hypothetical protein
MGCSTTLYARSLLLAVSLDWRPSSQYILVSVMPSCFRLAKMWLRQVSLRSKTEASSAKVAVVVSGEVGRSAVYRRYRRGTRTLPWGTPAFTGRVRYIVVQSWHGSVWPVGRIWGLENNCEGETFVICRGVLCAKLCQMLGRIEESCGTVMFIVKCFIYFVHNAMCLMDGGVSSIVGSLCLWVCFLSPYRLLGNISGKTIPLQLRRGVIFYVIRVVFFLISHFICNLYQYI